MNKYQFFHDPKNKDKYTFLSMSSEAFLSDKEMLLTNGYYVDGDPILATDGKEALKIYKSGFINAVDEHGKTDEVYAFTTFLIDSYKKIFKRKLTR